MSSEELNEPAPPSGTESRIVRVALRNLFLDPNNYRFIDHADYVKVEEADLANADVQRRTTGFILGRNQENVRDLIDSIKQNGWLPVDQIQVRRLESGKYVVVEGNRRIATLKHLQAKYENESADIGSLDPALFSSISVVNYNEPSPEHHLVLMGLKHISGNKKWPALNQAQLLRTLFQEYKLDIDEICKRLGIYRKTFTTALKTLDLCEEYKRSDYGDQFRSDKFSIFQEVIKSPAIRKWLGWEDSEPLPTNKGNLRRLFSWLSYEQDIEIEGEDITDAHGREPIITATNQVRELSKIIADPKAIENLEKTKSLSDAAWSSESFVKNRVDDSLSELERGVNLLFSQLTYLDDDALGRVEEIKRKIEGLAAAGEGTPKVLRREANRDQFLITPPASFTELTLVNYKKFKNVHFSPFSKINLFAGPNNCGKTSVLEAIYLLSQQSSIDALLEVIKWRGKIYDDLNPRWLAEQVPANFQIVGSFGGGQSSLEGGTLKEDSVAHHRAFYLSSIRLQSNHSGVSQDSMTRLFENSDRSTETTGEKVLCAAAFSTPFASAERGALRVANQHSIEQNVKRRIIEFVRRHFDSGIDAIELVDSFDRFLVTHNSGLKTFDLSDYGEGLQRVFHIGLQTSLARNGILLVDEIDNAIHTSLLPQFVDLLVDLTTELNVQLFATSHSKECIDAFANNPRSRALLQGFGLSIHNGAVGAKALSGEELKTLNDLMGADLRQAK